MPSWTRVGSVLRPREQRANGGMIDRAHVRGGVVVPEGDELGADAYGDLFGRDGADVEADRRVDAIERRQAPSLLDAL